MYCFQGHDELALLGPDISPGAHGAPLHIDARLAGVSAVADQKGKTGTGRESDQVRDLASHETS